MRNRACRAAGVARCVAAGGNGLVRRVGLRERVGGVVADEGVDFAVHARDLVEARLHDFARGDFASASLAVSSEMVSWFSIGRFASGLFHDFGHDEQSVGLGGRVAQRFLVRQRRPDFVGRA